MSNFKVHVSFLIIKQVQLKAAIVTSFADNMPYLGTFEYGKGCSGLFFKATCRKTALMTPRASLGTA